MLIKKYPFDDGPNNTFSAWRNSERANVSIELLGLKSNGSWIHNP